MTDGQRTNTSITLGSLQLAAILLQFGALIWMGGRWSAELNSTSDRVRELQSIVADLAKAQAQGQIQGATHGQRIEDTARKLDALVARLDRLEARK